MNSIKKIYLIAISFSLFACGGSSENDSIAEQQTGTNEEVNTEAVSEESTEMDPMQNKGIGPVTSVTLGEIDQDMVDAGEKLFKEKCSACHKPTERYIGPAPVGILDRRTPEWVMNMILNPDVMVKEDPIAKELLAEYLSPMANQSLTEDEARNILEYFRTLN